MQNKECLLLIGRILSETHPIEARLICRGTYKDDLIYSRYSEYKRRMIYELILEIYSNRYKLILNLSDGFYEPVFPTFSAGLTFHGVNLAIVTDRDYHTKAWSITNACTFLECADNRILIDEFQIKRISVELPDRGMFYDMGRFIFNINPSAVITINTF